MENNKKIISKYIDGVNKRYLYRDIKYDERGIDYIHFLKLRLTTFDNKHHYIDSFTPEGFRILWYLMTRSKESAYINTTLNALIQNLSMTRHKVIKGVKALIDSEVIEIYSSKENILQKIEDINKPIHILIKYHNDDLYSLDGQKGYRAIPFDFAYKCVTDLNEKEFTMLMFLITRNRYYYIAEVVDEDTGEITNYVNEVCYSFPTQQQISEQLKINRNDVTKYTESLELKGYIKTNKNYDKIPSKNKKTNRQELKNMNFTYKVALVNRMEYIKYQIINIANEEMKGLSKELKNYINKSDTDQLLIEYEGNNKISLTIKNKLFLEKLYGTELEEYYVGYKKEEEKE